MTSSEFTSDSAGTSEGGVDPVAAFLSSGETYGFPGVGVARVETHCSEVYLVGNQAYKRKRPVAFSALDYRTLSQRAAACRAELELNRRTAPELYLGNHTIRRRADGRLGLDGDGEVVDWLVAMRRFDQSDLFDRLTDAAQLTATTTRALANEIAGFHRRAEITPWSGGAAGLRQAVDQNQRDLASRTATLDRQTIDLLHVEAHAALEPLAALLDERRDRGKVRRVHGDLRLANICLIDGRPTLFDAIEFSDALTCIDMLYDTASLLADLYHRGAGLLANIFFNRYFDIIADGDNLSVMPLMLSIRAATRAYSLAGSAERHRHAAETAVFAASANSMLELASAVLRKSVPRLVAVGGFGGSRKIAVVEQIAANIPPVPGARILRSDLVRHRVAGIASDERLSANAYRPEIADRTYETIKDEACVVLKAGHSVVVDASFFYPRHRHIFHALSEATHVPFVGIWLGRAPDMLPASGRRDANDWPAVDSDDVPKTVMAVRKLLGFVA